MSNIVKLRIANQEHQLQVKEYQGQRVVTFKEIDSVHGRPEGTASRNFRENRKHFVAGEDYFELNQADEIRRFGITRPQGGTPVKVILISENGYLMLVKSLNDDLAWQVQRQLVKGYFRAKEIEADNLKQLRAQAYIDNAKTRKARFINNLAKEWKDLLSKESVQCLVAESASIATGKQLLPKPQIDIHFTATEIANELGVSANKIGRLANSLNLKNDQYGKWFLDKKKNCDGQVKVFMYNAKGRQAIIDAFNAEQSA